MKPTRLLGVCVVWVGVFVCANVAHVSAQPVIFVDRDPYTRDQSVPWGLPDELMERLASQGAEYQEAAAGFEWTETTQRVKYPRGRAAESATREATYVFALEEGLGTPVSVRGNGKSVKSHGRSKAPPAHTWMQLFSRRNQPYFAYRDLGEVPHAFGNARKIQFRGSLPYSDGADIRQWEGTILIDPFSLQPVELDARPLHLWPRLERQRRYYVNSFKFLFLRFKKKPIAERVYVRFDAESNGMRLPVDAHVERFEMTSPEQAVVRSRVVTRYTHDFDVDRPDSAP